MPCEFPCATRSRSPCGRGVMSRSHNKSLKNKAMNLMYIIQETALMMGFTFIVGIAFAYVLKGMTFFFSRFSGEGLSVWMGRGRVWARAYHMNLTHTYRNIWSLACMDDGSPGGCGAGRTGRVSFRESPGRGETGYGDEPFIRIAPWKSLIWAVFSRVFRPCCSPTPRSCIRASG